MASTKADASMRKRQQIDSSKRTMFITVAIAAFASGIALVVAFFLAQQIWFHSKIISTKQQTISTIRNNITAAEELKDNVRVLDANEALNSVKINEDSSAVQVILDALPAEANADALGASLQQVFVEGVDGLTIENIQVDSLDSESGLSTDSDADSEAEAMKISFNMSVSGPADSLKSLLARFERSIRVIELSSIELEAGSDQRLTLNLIGYAYYQPAQTIEINKKVIKP